MDRGVCFLLSVGLAGVVAVGDVAADQHEGHQGGAAPSAAQVTECRQAQPVIIQLLNAALKRLEDARLTNSPAAMRDAADDVQAALVDVRTQLAPCSQMGLPAEQAPATPSARTLPTQQPAAPPADLLQTLGGRPARRLLTAAEHQGARAHASAQNGPLPSRVDQ